MADYRLTFKVAVFDVDAVELEEICDDTLAYVKLNDLLQSGLWQIDEI